jgi:Na+/phosphate symporter
MRPNTHSFNSIINSGEQLYELAKDFDITELEEKMPEYSMAIQEHFVNLNENELTYKDVENLKKIMSVHEMITDLLNKKKEEISKDLKQLHSGKQMQNTYSQTRY